MKMIGNEVYIQRGEIWSLDFEVIDKKGHPLAILKNWKNPYIVITVSASLYEQKGDHRESYWLDLATHYVEHEDGNIVSEKLKRFTYAEALPIASTIQSNGEIFSINEVLATYGVEKGGKIVLDSTSDFDVTNFLFFVDPLNNGEYVYKYVNHYDIDADGVNEGANDEEWKEYNFRIIKRFTTRDWIEQRYFYDIKIVAGESVQEGITRILKEQGITSVKATDWTQDEWIEYINMISDDVVREEMMQLYEDGVPLMPGFDTHSILLEPTPIYVSVNLQGGVE